MKTNILLRNGAYGIVMRGHFCAYADVSLEDGSRSVIESAAVQTAFAPKRTKEQALVRFSEVRVIVSF